MELPWKKAGKLRDEKEKLEAQLDEKNEKIDRLENMLEAEEERRSDLSREKQEAEEQLSKLKDKVQNLESTEPQKRETAETKPEFAEINFEAFKSALQKLGSIKSDKNDLITVYSPEKLANHSQITEIRNSLPENILRPLNQKKGLIIFYSDSLGLFCFKLRSFFSEKFSVAPTYKAEYLIEALETEKIFALVLRGDTRIVKERDGKIELVEHVKDRVNRKHGKGGFSQGRFERKRDEQIEMHIENVEAELKPFDTAYLLGDEALCQKLPGEHLGGFDPNSSDLSNLYGLQKLKTSIQ